MTLKKAKEGFINYCKYEKKLSKKTIEAYKTDLKQFEDHLNKIESDSKVKAIDKHALRSYLKSISGFKPKTVKRKIATLKVFFNFLEFEDEVIINPFRKVRIKIKVPRSLPQVMNLYQVKRIFNEAYSSFRNTKKGCGYLYYSKLRDIAVLELLFATGIRVSELCSLKKRNINTDTGLLRIIGKGNKERIVQVCNLEVLNILRELEKKSKKKGSSSSYFFINRINRKLSDQSVRNMVKSYVKKASLSKEITPHTFRHTFATLLLEEGVDVTYIQHMLGHSSVATTQIYTHVNGAKQRQILTNNHPRNAMSF